MDYSEPQFNLYDKVSSLGITSPKQNGTIVGIVNHNLFQSPARCIWDEQFPGWQIEPVYYVKLVHLGPSTFNPHGAPASIIAYTERELQEYDWTDEIEESLNNAAPDEHGPCPGCGQ